MNIDYEKLCKDVGDVVHRISAKYLGNTNTEIKADGSFVTEVDLLLQNSVKDLLTRQYPDIAFLGEEMTEQEQREVLQTSQSFWCLDPLDGTTNFASQAPFWCLSLGLIVDGQIVFGLIVDPAHREIFHAIKGQGAFLNQQRLHAGTEFHELKNCIANVDLKRLTPAIAEKIVQQPPYQSQRNFGSCALEWCWIAAGRIQVYLHGGMKFWDYAAGSLILGEAGGFACTLQGEPVYSGDPMKRSVVAACQQDLFEQWKRYLEIET